jgi:hypothetical protein
MPDSAAWSKHARMCQSSWLFAGRICGARSTRSTTSTQSPLAAEALARIAKLYEIEGDIRGQPPDVRKAVRQLRSRPLVDALHIWLQEHLPRVPGWSDLAKAMRYALRHWDGLILYLDDGRLEMDSNAVERVIRRNHYEKELTIRGIRRWRVILPIWRCPYKASEFCRG